MSGSISRSAAIKAGGGTKEMIFLPPEALVIDKEFDLREDLGDIEGLAQSIKEDGFHTNEPVLVRYNKLTEKFHVADGRRRTRSAVYAKEKLGWVGKVAAVPLDPKTSDQDLIFRTMNSNNEHRKPFTAMEEGAYFLKLRDELKVPETEIAEKIFRSITHVRDRIALVKLEPTIKTEISNFISTGVMSTTAAQEIAKEKDPVKQVEKWNEIKELHRKNHEDGKSTKIKVQHANRITKGHSNAVSIKNIRANKEKLDKLFEETKQDRYSFAAKVIQAILDNKMVSV